MTSYVLVHGAWAGAWAWHEVVPRLRDAGHDVATPDLPAHGVDTTSPGDVSLDDYVDRVVAAIEAAGESVVLVGHSAGGMTITRTAERVPTAVEALVYVCAFLPADGQSLLDLAEAPDDGAAVEQEVDEAAGVTRIVEGTAREAFLADCRDADVVLADTLRRPEPLAPLGTPVDVSDGAFGSVPRAYVRCKNDRAITPANQDRMLEATPCEAVYELDTSHSPFFAAPDRLAECLLSVPEDVA